MSKDIQRIIIKKYLEQLTFVNLFNLTRNKGKVEEKTEEILSIPLLKRVSKVWRDEIKAYFAKEWKQRSKNVKEDMRKIISGNISFFAHDTYWKSTKGCILKKHKGSFFIRCLCVILGNHPKINYAFDVPIFFDKIKKSFILQYESIVRFKMAYDIVKDNFLLCGPIFNVTFDGHDHLYNYLPDSKDILKIISPVPFNDLEVPFPPNSFVEYKDIDWGIYDKKTAYFLSVREDLKLLKNYFLENAIEI